LQNAVQSGGERLPAHTGSALTMVWFLKDNLVSHVLLVLPGP